MAAEDEDAVLAASPVGLNDVVYINGEKYVCYDRYLMQNGSEKLPEVYGRFLNLSGDYSGIWKTNVDYQNGVKVNDASEAPEYGTDKGMEQEFSDLSQEKAILKYGIEDSEGEPMEPRFYVDDKLFSDPAKLNTDHPGLSEMILDAIDKDDDEEIRLFAGTTVNKGQEKCNWTGYLDGASTTAVDNICTYSYDLRYTKKNEYPAGYYELNTIKDKNKGIYENSNCFAYLSGGGGLVGASKNKYSTSEQNSNHDKAKKAFDAYTPYSNSNRSGYKYREQTSTPLEWHTGKTAYSKQKTVSLDDYKWQYSDNVGLKYDAEKEEWVNNSGTESRGTFKVGGTIASSGAVAAGGKTGTPKNTGKRVYSIADRNGMTVYSTKEVLPFSFTYTDYTNSSNNRSEVNKNKGTATSWYVDASASLDVGTPGTVDNAKETYFFPSIDLKITDNNEKRNGMSLSENHMFENCYVNDRTTGNVDFNISGISQIDTTTSAIDNIPTDIHYTEGDIDITELNPVRKKTSGSYPISAKLDFYEMEKTYDETATAFGYEIKCEGGEISGDKIITNSITEDTVFMLKVTDEVSGEIGQRLIYVEPAEAYKTELVGDVTVSQNEASVITAGSDVRLTDRAHRLEMIGRDQVGNEDIRFMPEDFMLLGKDDVSATLEQLRIRQTELLNDMYSSDEELKLVSDCLLDYESIDFTGVIDNENKLIKSDDVSGSKEQRRLMVVLKDDHVAGISRARESDITYRGYCGDIIQNRFMNYSILTLDVLADPGRITVPDTPSDPEPDPGETEIERLRRENSELAAENQRLKTENERLKSENTRLSEENKKLKQNEGAKPDDPSGNRQSQTESTPAKTTGTSAGGSGGGAGGSGGGSGGGGGGGAAVGANVVTPKSGASAKASNSIESKYERLCKRVKKLKTENKKLKQTIAKLKRDKSALKKRIKACKAR